MRRFTGDYICWSVAKGHVHGNALFVSDSDFATLSSRERQMREALTDALSVIEWMNESPGKAYALAKGRTALAMQEGSHES